MPYWPVCSPFREAKWASRDNICDRESALLVCPGADGKPDKEDRLTSSSWMLIIYVVAFIAIFYFMAIRPQQRQRRAHQALLTSLKRGDTVQTAAGIYGKVKKVEDNVVEVEVAKGVTMKIARRAVVEIIRDSAEARNVAPATGAGRGKRAAAELEESTDSEGAGDMLENTDGTDESDQDSSNSAS